MKQIQKKKEIPFSVPYIDNRETAEVVKVLKGKWITTGDETKLFENKVKEYLEVPCAVATASGTAALEISLAVKGLDAGNEVLTTAYTFASTALAAVHLGAEPVFADIQENTFNIDPVKIEEFISTHYTLTHEGLKSKKSNKLLKGIIPVHFGGQSADMDAINAIARKNNLFVVEDAAHALGASYNGRKVGQTSNLVCFSFYSNKNITTGEGGMVVTQDADLEQKIRMYGLHGISKTAVERYKTGLPFYDIVYPGYKANLTDIQAALGVVQIQKLEQITHKRNRAAAWYDECLSGVEEIVTPIIRESNYSARHLYPILLNQKLKPHRDDIILRLRSHGIYSSVHFIPIYFHTFFKNFLKEIPSLPVTEDHFYREISLPLFPALKKGEVKYVCEVLKGIIVGLK